MLHVHSGEKMYRETEAIIDNTGYALYDFKYLNTILFSPFDTACYFLSAPVS